MLDHIADRCFCRLTQQRLGPTLDLCANSDVLRIAHGLRMYDCRRLQLLPQHGTFHPARNLTSDLYRCNANCLPIVFSVGMCPLAMCHCPMYSQLGVDYAGHLQFPEDILIHSVIQSPSEHSQWSVACRLQARSTAATHAGTPLHVFLECTILPATATYLKNVIAPLVAASAGDAAKRGSVTACFPVF